ncbi:MAG TPA: RNA polymerase sigma factor [Terracidiphilus sp.]|nr:RNA polymerase sigma factor [Terracidiphilus sp.]
MATVESIAGATQAKVSAAREPMDRGLLDELWRKSDGRAWGLERVEFDRIMDDVAAAMNFGLGPGLAATRRQRAEFFLGLRLNDLVLARACAAGNELAWERFVALHRQPLIRAAIAITGSETLGRELADQIYAELFGFKTRDGERRCPLLSYRGRGSLMGWLRTILAQRHVDHHRRNRRLTSIEDAIGEFDAPAAEAEPAGQVTDSLRLEKAIEEALSDRDAEDRFLLAAYYLDGQTLSGIAQVLGVHEATVSRKLRRSIEGARKHVIKNLQRGGLSKRAAEEALGADPRDLDVNLKKALQASQVETFQEQAEEREAKRKRND